MPSVPDNETNARVSRKVESQLDLSGGRGIYNVEGVASLSALFTIVDLRWLASTTLVHWTQHLDWVVEPVRVC
jgi:hypothetical protein